jgi:hypothetical protein
MPSPVGFANLSWQVSGDGLGRGTGQCTRREAVHRADTRRTLSSFRPFGHSPMM